MAVGQEIEQGGKRAAQAPALAAARNGTAAVGERLRRRQIPEASSLELLAALEAARDGDFQLRLPAGGAGIAADLHRAFNELADRREAFSKEVARVGRAIGREGRLTERAAAPRSPATGSTRRTRSTR